MKRALALALILALGSALAALAQPSASDEARVRQTVEAYLHGLKFNDVDSLKKAFWPDAKLLYLKKDKTLGQLTQEQWYEGLRASAGQEEQGDLKIVSINLTGPGAAVKVVEVYPKSTYTDYLSLLEISGEWKIVNKIYVVDKR